MPLRGVAVGVHGGKDADLEQPLLVVRGPVLQHFDGHEPPLDLVAALDDLPEGPLPQGAEDRVAGALEKPGLAAGDGAPQRVADVHDQVVVLVVGAAVVLGC